MKKLFLSILGFFGINVKEAKLNLNNQPTLVPQNAITKIVVNVAEKQHKRHSEVLTPAPAPTIADMVSKASPGGLLRLLSIRSESSDPVTIVPRSDGKPPKVAMKIAPRSGRKITFKIVGEETDDESANRVLFQRRGHPRGPIFSRPPRLVVGWSLKL